MTKITPEEIVKLAQLSQINIIDPQEIEQLTNKLNAVLIYASRLSTIVASKSKEQESLYSIESASVTRPDTVIKTAAEPLLALAPSREENYFTVPMILKHN
jgi:aspartyl/glutamyl-tRNA(Asn/Gln) amidotransferase C subunit